MIEHYTIADMLTWLEDKTLVINRDYQRSDSVWPQAAKAYLIDTILRDLPIPPIYLRTDADPVTLKSYREVVDGQQRISAIKSFVDGEFSLGQNQETFQENAGKKYLDLEPNIQRDFLNYQVPCAQLFNAPDPKVFDIFRRLNTYNYRLSPQELRHGKYQGRFRDAVVETTRRWSVLWDTYQINNKRARVRMADDELTAQMYGVVLEGVCDGGQPKIERLYKKYDSELPSAVPHKVESTIEFIIEKLDPVMHTGLAAAPHYLMLFAAVSHARIGIPKGDMGEDFPAPDERVLKDLPAAVSNLSMLGGVLDIGSEEVPKRFADFKTASSATTQRIRSRRVRFPILYKALFPEPI